MDKHYIRAKILIEQLKKDQLYICQRCGTENAEPPNGDGDILCWDCLNADSKEQNREYDSDSGLDDYNQISDVNGNL